MSLKLAPIHHRGQFGDLLTRLGLIGRAVEIGTHRGAFAEALLRTWPGQLWCIDPWSVPRGYEAQAEILTALGSYPGDKVDRNYDMTLAEASLAPHHPRVQLMRARSTDAVCLFPDDHLDFVYIDGDHHAAAVDADVRAWWPKLRCGGILAGHDFLCPGAPLGHNWGPGVQAAAVSIAERHGLDVELLIESDGAPWSFMVRKE